MVAANIAIGSAQPILTRYGAVAIDPLLFGAGSVIVAAICAAATLQYRGELGLLFDRRYLPSLCAVGMFGTFATTLLLVYGFRHVDAVAGVLLLETEPIYSLLLAAAFGHERPSRRQLAATAVILAGVSLVFVRGVAFSPLSAALLLLITPLFWQISHIVALRVMPPLTPIAVAASRSIFASFAMAALLALSPNSLRALIDPTAIAVIAGSGVFIYFLGAITWYAAISRLSLTWTTALAVPSTPLLSVLLAIIFLDERASAPELIGIAIAIVGVLGLVLGAEGRRIDAREAAEAIHHPLD